jgi:hypothetical protein
VHSPQWKGLAEVEGNAPELWLRGGLAKRFQYGVYSEDFARSLAGDVVGIFIAKSSAWLPPWHDPAFAAFVRDAALLTRLEVASPYKEQEGMDPLAIRVFDVEEHKVRAAQVQEMIDAFRNDPNRPQKA